MSQNHDPVSAKTYLKRSFRNYDWDNMALDSVPRIEMRVACEKHQSGFTAENWPKKEYMCGCLWTSQVEFMLDAGMREEKTWPVKGSQCIVVTDLKVAKAKDEASQVRGGVSASEDDTSVAGEQDKVTNTGNEMYDFPRRPKLINRMLLYGKAGKQFVELLRIIK